LDQELGPSTDRGLVAIFSAGSIVLAAMTVWLLMTFSYPIGQPEWGLAVFAGAVLCGAGGLLVSLLHLRRNESDRLFGFLSLTLNAAAVTIPMVWMVVR
jgi:hypothetical protein